MINDREFKTIPSSSASNILYILSFTLLLPYLFYALFQYPFLAEPPPRLNISRYLDHKLGTHIFPRTPDLHHIFSSGIEFQPLHYVSKSNPVGIGF